jgi:hypothetical protein
MRLVGVEVLAYELIPSSGSRADQSVSSHQRQTIKTRYHRSVVLERHSFSNMFKTDAHHVFFTMLARITARDGVAVERQA